MSDQELNRLWEVYDNAGRGGSRGSRTDFYAAVREAVAAKTRELVGALRPLAAISCKCHEGYPASVSLWDRITDCDCRAWKSATLGDIREAARLVAEYDAAQQEGTTP